MSAVGGLIFTTGRFAPSEVSAQLWALCVDLRTHQASVSRHRDSRERFGYTDVHITRGHIATEFPRTIGHEPVGEIVEIGPGVRTPCRRSRGRAVDSGVVRPL